MRHIIPSASKSLPTKKLLQAKEGFEPNFAVKMEPFGKYLALMIFAVILSGY
jgi:hypothetical protein